MRPLAFLFQLHSIKKCNSGQVLLLSVSSSVQMDSNSAGFTGFLLEKNEKSLCKMPNVIDTQVFLGYFPPNPVSEPSRACGGKERDRHNNNSHYSLYPALGSPETQTIQGRMVPTSLSCPTSTLNPCFQQGAFSSSSPPSDMEFSARLGEAHGETLPLPRRYLC